MFVGAITDAGFALMVAISTAGLLIGGIGDVGVMNINAGVSHRTNSGDWA
jgi:hypothetical protein